MFWAVVCTRGEKISSAGLYHSTNCFPLSRDLRRTDKHSQQALDRNGFPDGFNFPARDKPPFARNGERMST
jgi:hypothetical protein